METRCVSPITESELIDQIAQRYSELMGYNQSEMLEVSMRICWWHEAIHALDLEKLLHAPDFIFAHDVGGMIEHLCLFTGEVSWEFVPRCKARDHGQA